MHRDFRLKKVKKPADGLIIIKSLRRTVPCRQADKNRLQRSLQMPEDRPRLDESKKIIIRRIVRNYIVNRLDTLCLAFGRLPEHLNERIWFTAEYQKWARNEGLCRDELERLMELMPVEGLLDCLEGQVMLHSNIPVPPKVSPRKNRGVIIPFPSCYRQRD